MKTMTSIEVQQWARSERSKLIGDLVLGMWRRLIGGTRPLKQAQLG